MAPATGFEAFEPSVVVDEFARKIESLCVWKETIVAGLADGSLLFFDEVQTADQVPGGAPTISTWQVTRVQKGFAKRGIWQLHALEGQSYLLSLTDDGVQLHSLPDCSLASSASRTARAAAFTWDEGRQLLATAAKKRVITHRLDRGEHSLQEMTEYVLPDAVICLSWVGSSIIAGTAKSYWLIVPAPPQTVEVLPGQMMTIYPAVQPQQLFAAGAQHPPLMTRIGSEEVLVTKDAVSYFLGPDGKPCRKMSLTWSQPPRALLCTPLYAIALLPSAVEVKGISRVGAAAAEQMLLLPGMAVAAPTPAPDGCIYIASGGDGGIRQLRPLPLERQAKLLAAAGDFQGALELLTVLEDEESAAEGQQAPGEDEQTDGVPSTSAASRRRQQLEDVLRLRFGYHLFEAGECDEALTQFSMCSDPDPLLLLRLYPDLVPDKFKPLLPTAAYGEPLPDIQQQQQQSQTAGDDATAAAGVNSSSSGSDSSKQLKQQQQDNAAAVAVVVPYLLSHRTRLLAQLEAAEGSSSSSGSSTDQQGPTTDQRSKRLRRQQEQQDGSSGGGSSSSGGSSSNQGSSSSSKPRSVQELKLLATVMDTAILRAMLLQPDSGALLRLVQQPNYVDLEDGESVLTSCGRYAELAALYQYHHRHEQGLRLLQQLSQAPESLSVAPTGAAADLKGLPGVWAAVRYLAAVKPQDVDLLTRHAGWILTADPEAGLEALLAMNPPLQPEVVLPILEAHAPAYTAVYLESALELGQVSPGQVHSELLLIYLHMALEEEREGEASSEVHARQLSLSDLLVSRPHTPLKLFPDDHTLWAAPCKQRKAAAAAAAAAAAGSSNSSSTRLGGTAAVPKKAAAADSKQAAAAVPPPAEPETEATAASTAAAPQYDAATLAAPYHPDHRRDAYERLRELVYASPHIDPDYVLNKLGQGQLLEIRALMLERLGRHREALSVYIHDLKSMKLAEEYCDRVYEAGVAAAAAEVAAAAGPSSAAAAAAAAAASTAVTAAAADAAGGGWDSSSSAAAWGSSRPGAAAAAADSNAAAAATSPKWGRVQRNRQPPPPQPQQQQGRRGPSGVDRSKRSWSARPFGSKPQDIYMELVDAVLQGPGGQPNGSSLPPPPAAPPAAKGAQQQQQQQRQQPAPVDRQAWQQLSELLARKSDRINHLQVFEVLPQELSLSDVSPLLCSMLVYNTEQSRNLDVVLHLRRAENLMAREDVVKVKQRVVPLTFDRACCICHKRMGGAVSVAYPSGSLAHYLCYKRSTQQQQQQQPSAGSSSEQPQQQQQQQGNGIRQPGWLPSSVQQQQQRSDWGGMVAAVAQ